MSGLTKAIRNALKPFRDANEIIGPVNSIKTAAKSVGNVVGNIFENFKYTLQKNVLHVNNVGLNTVEHLLRRGELIKFARITNSNVVVKAIDERGFRATLSNIPDMKLRQLDESIGTARRVQPNLDVPVRKTDGSVKTAEELAASMTPAARKTFEGAMSKIKAAAGASLVVGGVFVAFQFGSDFYKTIIEATENRRGCFLIRTIDGKTVGCKLPSRTCGTPSQDQTNYCQTNPENVLYNPALYLIAAIKDSTINTELSELLGTDIDETAIPGILGNTEKFQLLKDKYYNDRPELKDICRTSIVGLENNTVPNCRACTPAADVNSTEYVDISNLADNYTLQCVHTVSMLDTLIDAANSLGVKLFSNLNPFSDSLMKNIWILVMIFVALLAIGLVAFFGSKLSNKAKNTKPANNSMTVLG